MNVDWNNGSTLALTEIDRYHKCVKKMSDIVEFKVTYKDENVSGYMYLDEADDETPVRFYGLTGQEQWNIPTNPYRNAVNHSMMVSEIDYDYLVAVINNCSIFVQFLVDFSQEKGKEILLDKGVVLTIN